MKKKYQIVFSIVLLLLLTLVVYLFYNPDFNSNEKRLDTAITELKREQRNNQDDRVECKALMLKNRSDFSRQLEGKSVEQIKSLLRHQPGVC